MDTNQIKTLLAFARDRAFILNLSSAWGTDEDGFLISRLCDVISEFMGEEYDLSSS